MKDQNTDDTLWTYISFPFHRFVVIRDSRLTVRRDARNSSNCHFKVLVDILNSSSFQADKYIQNI